MEKREQIILGRIFESFTQFDDMDAVKKQLVHSVSELAEADAVRLYECPADSTPHATRSGTAWAAPRIAERLDAQFDAVFWKDPLCQHLFTSPQTTFNVPEYTGALDWSESTLYRTLLNPLGLHDSAMLLLRSPSVPKTGAAQDDSEVRPVAPANDIRWCVWLGHARRNGLTRRRLRVLDSIAPQLYAGLNNLTIWHERWKRARAIESMLHLTDDLLVCVALGSGTPRLVAATRAAQQVLNLQAAAPTTAGMNEFLELAARTHPAALQTPAWRAADGRTFRLSAMPGPDEGEGRLRLIRLEASGMPVPASDDLSAARVAGLSAREAAVFARMSRGLGNREIAEALGISIDTVRAHLRNMFAKLDVCSRVEAVNAVRSQARDHVFRDKIDSSIDTPDPETNVCGERDRRLDGNSSLPEPASHDIGITAQAT